MSGVHPSPGGGLRYEAKDVDARAVVRLGLVVGVVSVAVALVLLPFLGALGRQAAREDPAPAPVPRFEPGRLPPEPRLQTHPYADYRALAAAEAELAGSWALVDKEKGLARIPVEEAMKIVLRKGLPLHEGPPAPQPSPVESRP
jgi:hypothetical protein